MPQSPRRKASFLRSAPREEPAPLLHFIVSTVLSLPVPTSKKFENLPVISCHLFPRFPPRGTHREWGRTTGKKQIAELAHSTAVLFIFFK